MLTITNSGNAALTITGMSGPSVFTTNWPSGTIPPGASQAATIGFSPTTAGTVSGTITVNADHTSGTNTIPVSATAIPNFAGAWNGTLTISLLGVSNTCTETWIIASQNGPQFVGTWQTSGGSATSCGQAGTVTGSVLSDGTVRDVTHTVAVGTTTCTRVSGGQLNGTFSGLTLTAQGTDVQRCPSAADVTRSFTLALRKQ
jgi:hypothetical protein